MCWIVGGFWFVSSPIFFFGDNKNIINSINMASNRCRNCLAGLAVHAVADIR